MWRDSGYMWRDSGCLGVYMWRDSGCICGEIPAVYVERFRLSFTGLFTEIVNKSTASVHVFKVEFMAILFYYVTFKNTHSCDDYA